jgi:hypothetical protein
VVLSLFYPCEAQTFTYIAGYEPFTNVTNHARIDLDVVSIISSLSSYDYATAKSIFENGENSWKTEFTLLRNIDGFSGASKMANEKWFKTANQYWAMKGVSTESNYNYASVMVKAGMDGSSVGSTGFTFSDKDNAYKVDAIKKSIVYLNIWMYVIWEMQDAIDDCVLGDSSDNYASVHAWDEAVAFYTGSNEGTSQGGDNALGSPSGTGIHNDGVLLFNLAEKRCQNFGTCTADYDSDPTSGYSAVNNEIFAKFTTAKTQLQNAHTGSGSFTCKDIYEAKDEIATLMLVPLIQGTLRYLYKTDAHVTGGDTSSDTFKKENGELFAFSAGIQPFVYNCSVTAGNYLYERSFNDDMSLTFEEHKASLESVYSCLGISCTDIGGLCDTGSSELNCPAYTDGSASWDTSTCTDTAAYASTTSDNDSVPSWAVGLISFFCVAFVLTAVGAVCLYQRGNRYKNMVPEESMGLQPAMIQGKMMNVGSSHERVPANDV